MNHTREINALFTLMDDPDQEVYTTVSDRIVYFGKAIIPSLENLWENTLSEHVQKRIETLIHRLHYKDLKDAIINWNQEDSNNILEGALLVAKYQYPDLQKEGLMMELEKMKRNIWLELNNFLTPLEQANVLSSIMYNYYNFKGNEVDYKRKDDFFLNKVIIKKKGNALTNGIIYQSMCELLEINAKIINIPRHFIIAFYESDFDSFNVIENPKDKIHFFVDGTTGQAYSHLDIENYLKKMKVSPHSAVYYQPLSNRRIIQTLIEELSICFEIAGEEEKKNELLRLSEILSTRFISRLY